MKRNWDLSASGSALHLLSIFSTGSEWTILLKKCFVVKASFGGTFGDFLGLILINKFIFLQDLILDYNILLGLCEFKIFRL